MFIEKETGLTWYNEGGYQLRTTTLFLGDNSVYYYIKKAEEEYVCYYCFDSKQNGTQIGWLFAYNNLDEAVGVCERNYKRNYPRYK